MKSGRCSHCTQDARGAEHGRCHMETCGCPWHDQDVRDKAATLAAQPVDEPVQKDLAGAVKRAALAALEVTTQATGLDALPAEDCLRILYALRSALEHLRDTEASLVREIYLKSDHGEVQVPGLPVATVNRSRDRKNWDARGAALAYVDAQMIARDGELPEPGEVASWVLDLCGVSYLRVTQLRAMGLDVREYCDETPGSLRVVFSD